MHCLRKGHLNPSKIFFWRFRKYDQNQKSNLNLNFSDDSENVFLTKRPSESEFFRWIQKLVFLTKRPSESEFFRWIQKLYSWPKGHLNPSESEFFRWIEKMYILVKRSLESIWHWNSFMDTGKRFCLLKPRGKMLEVRQIMFSIEWSLESHIVSNVQIDSEKKHDKFDPSVIYSFEYLNLIVKDQFQNLCPHNVSLFDHTSKLPSTQIKKFGMCTKDLLKSLKITGYNCFQYLFITFHIFS